MVFHVTAVTRSLKEKSLRVQTSNIERDYISGTGIDCLPAMSSSFVV